jgi:hypothetical protein
MTIMKRRTAIAVALGVWIGGLGSAAAVTYELNRTLPLAGATSRPASPINAVHAPFATQGSEPESVLYIPTITIVGQAPHRPSALREPKPVTEIGAVRPPVE